MANINCFQVQANNYSENILQKKASFDYGVDYTINSGSGLIELQNIDVFTSDVYVFKGTNSLKVTNTDYKNTDLVFSSPSGLDSVQVDAPTNCFISFFVLNPIITAINTNIKLDVFMDGSPSDSYLFPLNATTLPRTGDWSRIGQNIFLDTGFVYTFRWTLQKETASVPTSRTIYIDGLCVQKLNQNSLSYPPYSYPKEINLSTTQTIDIPSIGSNDFYVGTVTLTGAQVGDNVLMTYPNELITLGLVVGVPLVTDVDTIKFVVHNHGGGSVNPASGSFTFKINK